MALHILSVIKHLEASLENLFGIEPDNLKDSFGFYKVIAQNAITGHRVPIQIWASQSSKDEVVYPENAFPITVKIGCPLVEVPSKQVGQISSIIHALAKRYSCSLKLSKPICWATVEVSGFELLEEDFFEDVLDEFMGECASLHRDLEENTGLKPYSPV